MAREITYFPTDENIEKKGPYPVQKILTYGSIDITRVIGKTALDKSGWRNEVTRTICYPNASAASRDRLHRAVANRLNKGKASIDFIQGTLGLGYGVEL